MGPSFEKFNWDKAKQSQLLALAIRCTKELYLECQASPQYAYLLERLFGRAMLYRGFLL